VLSAYWWEEARVRMWIFVIAHRLWCMSKKQAKERSDLTQIRHIDWVGVAVPYAFAVFVRASFKYPSHQTIIKTLYYRFVSWKCSKLNCKGFWWTIQRAQLHFQFNNLMRTLENN
jgi:hypothetical protein